MRERRESIGGVPARLYVPPDASALLLLGHGGGHSKDRPRFVALAREHARRTGLALLCIDAVDHGERTPAEAGSGVPRAWHSMTIGTMVHDWQASVDALASIGPAVAYVGFSMGVIFGVPTVAAMPSIRRTVFVAGGFPTEAWVDDPQLRETLEVVAGRLEHTDVLMLNKTDDELFPLANAKALFAAVHARRKAQRFWVGTHDDWPAELIDASTSFLAAEAS